MPEDGLLSRYTRQLKAANVDKTPPTRVAGDDRTRHARSAQPQPHPRSHGLGVLILREGLEDEHVFELGNDRRTIGRSHQSDIVLDDQAASRIHAIVTRNKKGTYRLCDQDSINGTYVNEQRISEQVLEDGDAIQIGLTVLAFRQE
jgi:pSer/pThr/pTyr-binding forkhead associated (FHA) protein